MRRRRLSAIPIIAVVAVVLVGLIGTTLTAVPAAAPSPDIAVPGVPSATSRPAPTPLGRYPRTAETSIVGSCVSGIDAKTVPPPIAQAFCVCVLNAYEQVWPSYADFERTSTAGTISEDLKTQISNRCVQAIVGG